jgi:MoaA/NifB/PqqE/SkfB family radical SAM enzyme
VDESLELCQEIVDLQVPYVALSGGEPLLYPGFWQVCKFLREHDVEVKIETNAQLITKEVAQRLADLNLRSVQVSLDGVTPESYNKMRPKADFSQVVKAIEYLCDEKIPTEIVYVPAKFNLHEAERLVDFAAELGVSAFYTGKTMFIGRAVNHWDAICPSEEQYEELVCTLKVKAKEYEGKMLIYYYPYDVIEELKYRLSNPAASLLVLSTGKVKLTGPLPFVCGDVRRHSLSEIWKRYQVAWRHPKVIEYAEQIFDRPELLSQALDNIELEL